MTRSVVVTGASRGIGRGIARAFRSAGDNVTITARSGTALDQVVEELGPEGTLAVPGDVTRLADLEATAAAARDRFGRLDVLCHNAGIYPLATIDETSAELWDEVLRSNLTSAFLSVKACAPHLRAAGGGSIVLISSITGPRVGHAGWSHYGAAKAGMLGFMRTAALELAPHGITVNAIEPGSIATDGQADLPSAAAVDRVRHIPVGRRGDPDDVAAGVLYLASERARFVTGQSIVVDGGQLLPEWPT